VPPALFISDLHLAPARPQMRALFERFIEQRARGASALYILGDLFEYWIGDDAVDAFNGAILDRLASLAESGVPVHFMVGNRDFFLGEQAAARGRLRRLPDPSVIDLWGERTLLMHGDTLCTRDLAYQRYRRMVRHPLFAAGWLALPVGARRSVVRWLRAQSEKRGHRQNPIQDVADDAVAAAFRVHGVRRLIHGHTHRSAEHTVVIGGERCTRWVLPDWYEQGGYLSITPESIGLAGFQ
jgi:UDP-2,3-diacylglucosamine hydrolase